MTSHPRTPSALAAALLASLLSTAAMPSLAGDTIVPIRSTDPTQSVAATVGLTKVYGSLPKDWTQNVWFSSNGSVTFSVDPNTYQPSTSGISNENASISVAYNNAMSQFYREIDVVPGKKYKVSFYVKSKIKQVVNAHLDLKDPQYTFAEASKTIVPDGTWQLISFEGTASDSYPTSTKALVFIGMDTGSSGAGDQGPGQIWVDNLSVVESLGDAPVGMTGMSLTANNFGIHNHRDTTWPRFGGAVKARRLWDREGVALGAIFPTAQHLNAPNWVELDKAMADASASGADLLMELGGGLAPWATVPTRGSDCGGNALPKDLTTWRQMVQAVVQHAAGRIKYWEIWNEPYHCNMITMRRNTIPGVPVDGVKALVDAAAAAYDVIKAYRLPNGANPDLKVLSPSFYRFSLPMLDQYLAEGGDRYTDILAIHNYDDDGGLFLTDPTNHPTPDAPERMFIHNRTMQTVRNVLKRYPRVANAPIWNTEAGYIDTQAPKGSPLDDQRVVGLMTRHMLLSTLAGVQRNYYYSWDRDNNSAALGRPLPASIPIDPTTNKQFDNTWNSCTASIPCYQTDAGNAYQRMAEWLQNGVITGLNKNCVPASSPAVWCVSLKPKASSTSTWRIVWVPTMNGVNTMNYTVPAGFNYVTPILGAKQSVQNSTASINGYPLLLSNN